MTINQYLGMFNELMEGTKINKIRPRIKCADGYTVSVQAGLGMYSFPRRFSTYFTHVELGYPSAIDEELLPYAENSDHPTNSVYGMVPVELVDFIINKHGGYAGSDFSNAKGWE